MTSEFGNELLDFTQKKQQQKITLVIAVNKLSQKI